MNPAAYLEMAELESQHWWFCGRRAILSKVLERLDLPVEARILEVGCGTGGNLDMLAKFGEVSALEMNAKAREIASAKATNRYDIRAGSCPNDIPFLSDHFDLICMFDVLEHIEEDAKTLVAIRQLLKKDGRLIITVPAYSWLWGAHDELLHHKRRYSANQLWKKVVDGGLTSLKISYFNTILFPIAALVRLKDRLMGNSFASETSLPPALINHVLTIVFSSERHLLGQFNFPFGVSLLCVLKASDDC